MTADEGCWVCGKPGSGKLRKQCEGCDVTWVAPDYWRDTQETPPAGTT